MKFTNKRVLLSSNRVFGISRSRRGLIEKILEQGDEVDILCVDSQGVDGNDSESGVRIVKSKALFGSGVLGYFWVMIKYLFNSRPEYLLSYNTQATLVSGVASWLFPFTRVIPTVTGLGRFRSKRGFVSFIIKILYFLTFIRSKKIFFQNSDDVSYFKDSYLPSGFWLPRVIRVNGSGVDLNQFKMAGEVQLCHKVCFIGRLIEGKGVDDFIQVAEIISRKKPQVKFVIAGELVPVESGGICKSLFENCNNIEFVGHISDVDKFMQTNDFLIYPSTYGEGMPRVVLEASACGVICFVYNTPGNRESVTNGKNGFVFEVGHVQAMADKIESFYDDTKSILTMKVDARKHAEAEFDIVEVQRAYLNVLNMHSDSGNK